MVKASSSYHMHIIGIEVNHNLVHDFEVNEAKYLDRFLLIPAAVSLKLGLAIFNTGCVIIWF